MKRYEALAADIAASIRNGLLKPGDKLPSVRQASSSRQVSPATAHPSRTAEAAGARPAFSRLAS